MSQIHFRQRVINYTLIYLVAVQSVLPVWAESPKSNDVAVMAVADGKSGLDKVGDGVPMVNIATPNSAGVSHNTYHQFNVGLQGLILNNATEPLTPTQLGGLIQNNPHLLMSGAASTIINEVISPHPSVLNGYLEVAGTAANVMIANPHGITCDGCGFIHTPDATLTTGKPQFDPSGQWSGLDVTGGSITMKGQGIDASQSDYFSLIARTMEINTGIHAKTLTVIAGANRINAQRQAVSQPGNGKVPRLAVDVSTLGGMYADNITLLATEQGVGVNLHNLTARSDDIQLDAQGKITLNQAVAAGSLRATGGELHLAGNQSAQGDMTFTSQSAGILDKAALAAGSRLTIKTDGRLTATDSQLSVGVDSAGNIGEQGELTLHSRGLALYNTRGTAAQLTARSNADSHQDEGSSLTARQLTLNVQQLALAGQLAARDNLLLSGRGLQGSKTAVIDSQKNLSVTLTDKSVWQGQMKAGGDLTLQGDQLTNAGQLLAAQRLLFDGNRLDNQGQIVAEELALTVPKLRNSGTLQGNNAVTLTATDLFTQAASGVVNTGNALTLDNDYHSVLSGILKTDGLLTLKASAIDNQGQMHGKVLDLHAQTLVNRGNLSGLSALTATVDDALNNHGTLFTQGTGILRTGALTQRGEAQAKRWQIHADTLDNHGTLTGSDGLDFTLTGKAHNYATGQLHSEGTSHLTAPAFNNIGLWQVRALFLNADNVINTGRLEGTGQTTLQLKESYIGEKASVLVSGGGATVTAPYIVNDGIIQGQTLMLTGDTLSNSGIMQGADLLTLQLSGDLTNLADGQLLAAQRLQANGKRLDNQGNMSATTLVLTGDILDNSGILYGDTIMLTANNFFMQAENGMVDTDSALILQAEQTETAGKLFSSQLTVKGDYWRNRADILVQDVAHITLRQLDNTGVIASDGETLLNVATLNNPGQLQADRLTLTGQQVDNAGQLQGKQQLTLMLNGGYHSALSGILKTDGLLTLKALAIDNQGQMHGKAFDLHAQTLANRGNLGGLSALMDTVDDSAE